MGINDPRGSIWRIWDLHVHTPASVLNNKFGNDWDNYVKLLFKTLIAKGISAVGITDYFTIEGYKKIKREYLSQDEKLKNMFSEQEIEEIKRILVLPNVELRSDIFVGNKSINYHVIFSDEVPIEHIEERFLEELEFRYESDPQELDRLRKLTTSNLIELGKRLKQEHGEFRSESDLLVGMKNAVIDDKLVSKALFDRGNTFKGKCLVVLEADEDISQINWNSRDHLTRKALTSKSDLIFSSNHKTHDWALGKPPYDGGPEKFISEFKSLKPCIHGSDAHEYGYIGNPCGKRGDRAHSCIGNSDSCDLRYCWIKADLTFEGLKQILYEPEDRVKIAPTIPESPRSTQTVSEFLIGAKNLDKSLTFRETDLGLNDKLVAITGGRGAGKTALVDLVANMFVDRLITDDKNSFVKRISDIPLKNSPQTTVTFRGGLTFQKSALEEKYIEGPTITYIAQGELERYIEDPTQLIKHINRLIRNGNEIKDSTLLFELESIGEKIINLVSRIHDKNDIIQKLEKETSQEKDVFFRQESERIKTELSDTFLLIKRTASSLTEKSINEAESEQRNLGDLRDKKAKLLEIQDIITRVTDFIESELPRVNGDFTRMNLLQEELGFGLSISYIKWNEKDKLTALEKLTEAELISTVQSIETFQKSLEEKEKGVKEHTNLLDRKKGLEERIEIIEKQKEELNKKKISLVGEKAERTELYSELLVRKFEQREKYLSIIETFSKDKSDTLKDLDFVVTLVFDLKRFNDTMNQLIDQRKVRIDPEDGTISELSFLYEKITEFTSKPSVDIAKEISHTVIEEAMEVIIQNLKPSELINLNRGSLYDSIFGDYFILTPSVEYKGTKLSNLSLGQKASVLLKIYLAQGENPIIIDSHDDHLDNEFIMDDLVKALRQAKEQRQVIIVSNNANVVVNSDSDQVVIADRNNSGVISYVSGSLENTSIRSKLLRVLEGGKKAFNDRQFKYRMR